MSRSENIAVVESYLNGLASKDLSSVPSGTRHNALRAAADAGKTS